METIKINAQHIGAQIKTLRQAKGWSLQKLSEVLATVDDAESGEPIKVGRGALGKWETGDNKIPLRYLVPLSAVLGVTPTVLLLGLPEHGGELQGKTLDLGGHEVTLERAYEWAYGERPLSDNAPRDVDPNDFVALVEAAQQAQSDRERFQLINRPHDVPPRLDVHGMLELERTGKLEALKDALGALFKAGLTPSELGLYVRERYIEEAPGTEVVNELTKDGWNAAEEIETAQGGEIIRHTVLRDKGHPRNVNRSN